MEEWINLSQPFFKSVMHSLDEQFIKQIIESLIKEDITNLSIEEGDLLLGTFYKKEIRCHFIIERVETFELLFKQLISSYTYGEPFYQIVFTGIKRDIFIETFTYRSSRTMLYDKGMRTDLISLTCPNRDDSFLSHFVEQLTSPSNEDELGSSILSCFHHFIENEENMKSVYRDYYQEEVKAIKQQCSLLKKQLKLSEERQIKSQVLFLKKVFIQRFGDMNYRFLDYLSHNELDHLIENCVTLTFEELKNYIE